MVAIKDVDLELGVGEPGPEDTYWINRCRPCSVATVVFWLLWGIVCVPVLLIRFLVFFSVVCGCYCVECCLPRYGCTKCCFGSFVGPLLGFWVSYSGKDYLDVACAKKSPTAVVFNHVTNFDPLYVGLGGLVKEYTLIGDGSSET